MQSRSGYFDTSDQEKADSGEFKKRRDFVARSGATLLIDARSFEIRRIIRTDGKVSDSEVLERHRAYRMGRFFQPTNAFNGLKNKEESATAFAALHRHLPEGDTS